MERRYPPDADASDVFGVSQENIEHILRVADRWGRETGVAEAYQVADLSHLRACDLLDWFGR